MHHQQETLANNSRVPGSEKPTWNPSLVNFDGLVLGLRAREAVRNPETVPRHPNERRIRFFRKTENAFARAPRHLRGPLLLLPESQYCMAIHRADGADPYLISTCARYETPTHTTRRVVRCLHVAVVFDWAAQSKRARKSVLRFPKKSNTTLIRVHRDGFRILHCFTRALPENEAVEIYQGGVALLVL